MTYKRKSFILTYEIFEQIFKLKRGKKLEIKPDFVEELDSLPDQKQESILKGLLKQPKPAWAVAFACVIAFMGIGLVDPI